MKKYLALFLACMMCISLTACGAKNDPAPEVSKTSEADSANKEKTKHIIQKTVAKKTGDENPGSDTTPTPEPTAEPTGAPTSEPEKEEAVPFDTGAFKGLAPAGWTSYEMYTEDGKEVDPNSVAVFKCDADAEDLDEFAGLIIDIMSPADVSPLDIEEDDEDFKKVEVDANGDIWTGYTVDIDGTLYALLDHEENGVAFQLVGILNGEKSEISLDDKDFKELLASLVAYKKPGSKDSDKDKETPTPTPTAEPTKAPTPEPTKAPTPEPTKAPHNHKWDLLQIVPSTCQAEGYYEYTCTCGENLKESTPIVAHNWVYQFSQSQSCENDGFDAYTCPMCTQTVYENYKAAYGHNYQRDGGNPPTCTTDGGKSWVCMNGCGSSYIEPIPAMGHDMQRMGGSPGDCENPGSKYWVCMNGCGYSETEVIPPMGHNLVYSYSHELSCLMSGYDVYACDRPGCTYEEVSNFVEATGHQYWFSICNNSITHTNVCFKCGLDYEDSIHHMSNGTCIECGYTGAVG